MNSVTIFGATGYAGAVLTRLIIGHPGVKLRSLVSSSQEGTDFSDIYPSLNGFINMQLDGFNMVEAISEADVIFTAMPHGKSASIASEAVKRGKKVIDISADFRISKVETYNQWYETEHPCAELLKSAVYGLPELNRNKIVDAGIIANPGCYPTAAILGLSPLLKNKLIDTSSIIIDAKSGVSGAGRAASVETGFVEVNENTKAYKIGSHRHTPEIEEVLSGVAGSNVTVTFSPHLIPMNRGILSTSYASAARDTSIDELLEIYKEFYKNEAFVRVLDKGRLPQTKWVSCSNHCDIGLVYDERTGRIVVVSAIDNLMKGAAGQAVQNMNIILGLDESTGLNYPGMIP